MKIQQEDLSFVVVSRDDTIEALTYPVYCRFLEQVSSGRSTAGYIEESGIFDSFKGNMSKLKDLLVKFGEDIAQIAKEKGLQIKDIAMAFASKNVFSLLKGFKFNFSLILKSLKEAAALINKGILGVFRHLENTGVVNALRKGTMKIDEVLNKYPLLKRVGGIVLAGLLLYMWMNMSYVGDISYDFDTDDIVNALLGKFDLTDLFLSAGGMRDLFIFMVGVTTGLSLTYLIADRTALLIGFVYTVFKKNKPAIAKKLSQGIKFVKLKVSAV